MDSLKANGWSAQYKINSYKNKFKCQYNIPVVCFGIVLDHNDLMNLETNIKIIND